MISLHAHTSLCISPFYMLLCSPKDTHTYRDEIKLHTVYKLSCSLKHTYLITLVGKCTLYFCLNPTLDITFLQSHYCTVSKLGTRTDNTFVSKRWRQYDITLLTSNGQVCAWFKSISWIRLLLPAAYNTLLLCSNPVYIYIYNIIRHLSISMCSYIYWFWSRIKQDQKLVTLIVTRVQSISSTHCARLIYSHAL